MKKEAILSQTINSILSSNGGMQGEAVILANGEYPTHEVPLNILHNTQCLVCCDGACMQALEHGIEPTDVVGDGDSLPLDIREHLGERLHIVNEQEFNDLTKATRFVLKTYPETKTIVYLAATGKREDHTLGNIFLMGFYADHFNIKPIMVTDHGYFVAVKGKQTFRSYPGQQVSLFNLSCKKFVSKGLKWNCYPYTMMWQGTLNEATDEEFEIDADGTYMIFMNW